MSKAEKKTPPRDDGRRQLTTFMDPTILKELKMAALAEDKKAYECVEVAVAEWLKRRKTKRTK